MALNLKRMAKCHLSLSPNLLFCWGHDGFQQFFCFCQQVPYCTLSPDILLTPGISVTRFLREQRKDLSLMGQMRVRRTGPWVKISCPFSWVQFKRLKGQIKGQTEKKKSETLRFQTSQWQREKDSNPHIRSQSPLCYHYTIPLYCAVRRAVSFSEQMLL